MTEIDFRALQDFFAADELEWRIQSAGKKGDKVWALCVVYVTNRAIQQRLDDVCGPGRWRNEFRPAPEGGVLCGISINVGGEWVTKWDGAENTDIEGVKGGLSAAMKRAAVQWGIGRYLYRLDEMFATVDPDGKHRGKTKDGESFKWTPPRLPAWALPGKQAAGKKQSARGERSAKHSTALAYLRAAGDANAVTEEHSVTLAGGKKVPLLAWLQENKEGIREQERMALFAAQAVEKATGFAPQQEEG